MRRLTAPCTIVLLLAVTALAHWDVRERPPFSPCDLPYEQQPFYTVQPTLHQRRPPAIGPWEEALTGYNPGPWNSSGSLLARFQRAAKQIVLSSMGLRQYVPDAIYGPVRAGVDWIFRHEFALPERLIRRSVSSVGERSRLRRVMHKLTQNRPIGIAVIGGSVSEGGGTHENWKTESYVGRLFTWLSETFPNRPHVLRNGAIGGTTTVYYGQCVQDFVPEADIDLVIVEFTVNDKLLLDFQGNATDYAKQTFELLMRKLLLYKNRPAVLVVHYWSAATSKGGFTDTYEHVYESVVQYYGLQSLSWRNAMYHAVMSNETGFSQDVMFCDFVHPTPLGHRYLGDMLIAFFQDAIADILSNPLTKADNTTANAALPAAMMNGTNPEDSQCWRNEGLESTVVSSKGWEWRDEGKRGRHKYGYVTSTPDSVIEFEFSTECTGNRSSLVNIGVGHLKSYAKMGLAEVHCVAGCTCKSAILNGTWTSPSSQENWLYVFATQAPKCRLRVVAKEAENGNVKVKLTSLLKSCFHSSMTSRQQYGGWHQYLHWSELDLDQHGAGKEDEADPDDARHGRAVRGVDGAGKGLVDDEDGSTRELGRKGVPDQAREAGEKGEGGGVGEGPNSLTAGS